MARGCFGMLCLERGAPAVDRQDVTRMHRDTPYSIGVFDLATPLTIVKPDAGKRFQSPMVVNQDHCAMLVAYDPGTYTLARGNVGTRYVMVGVRTFMDPNDPADVEAAHAARDGLKTSQAAPGTFEAPEWDPARRAALSTAPAGLMGYVPDSRKMFGKPSEIDPVRNDGQTPHVLTVKDVPVDGFWSVTIYNAKAFFEAPDDAISVNYVSGKRNADGSMTSHCGDDSKAANHLRIRPGWNYIVRLYRPRAELLDGRWTFPEPVPAK